MCGFHLLCSLSIGWNGWFSVSLSLLEKRRIYKRRVKNFTLSMQLFSGKNEHIQARYYYYPTEVMKSAVITCDGRNHENFILWCVIALMCCILKTCQTHFLHKFLLSLNCFLFPADYTLSLSLFTFFECFFIVSILINRFECDQTNVDYKLTCSLVNRAIRRRVVPPFRRSPHFSGKEGLLVIYHAIGIIIVLETPLNLFIL